MCTITHASFKFLQDRISRDKGTTTKRTTNYESMPLAKAVFKLFGRQRRGGGIKRNKNRRRRVPKYVKGVDRYGHFYRYKLDSLPPPSKLLKLPIAPTNTVPKQFKPVPTNTVKKITETTATKNAANSSVGGATTLSSSSRSVEQWKELVVAWWKENWAVLLLNFGSICSLLGFTRSDVLELRQFSVVGNICFVSYQLVQAPIRWAPIGWSTIFASVNLYKIAQIYHERTGHVIFQSEEEQQIYERHFQPHGITPKQFQFILERATILKAKKGDKLMLEQNQVIPKQVCLVVDGQTRAHNLLGRKLTAVSVKSHSDNNNESSAWIGEMAFLEWLHWKENLEHQKRINRNISKPEIIPIPQPDNNNDGKTTTTTTPETTDEAEHCNRNALYTVTAKTDCTLLCWNYEDMAALYQKSPDLKAALTRSMTAAVVGKVINFAVSRSKVGPDQYSFFWRQLFQSSSKDVPMPQAPQEQHDEDEVDNMNLQGEQELEEATP